VTPFSVAVGYRRFGGPFCLHLEDDDEGVHPEDGSSKALQNDGILPQHYTHGVTTQNTSS